MEKSNIDALPDLNNDYEFILEGVKIDAAIQITQAMKAAGISGAQLAQRMGVKPSAVSNILRHAGSTSLTTLAKAAAALELDIEVKLLPRKAEHRSLHSDK